MGKTSFRREEELWERKKNFCGYRYCPLCGNFLKKEIVDKLTRLKCSDPACDFIYYHNPIPAAGALVIKDGKILLVKRANPPKQGWWCIPAGFMEWSEGPDKTAVREVEEETGLKIKLESLFEVYSGEDDPRTNAVLILYTASILEGRLKPGDDAEEAAFFGFEELPENIAFISNRQALEDYRRRVIDVGKK
jgi:ADP-ribose pyrophosphatase YjhB (NUDIX family)